MFGTRIIYVMDFKTTLRVGNRVQVENNAPSIDQNFNVALRLSMKHLRLVLFSMYQISSENLRQFAVEGRKSRATLEF